MIDVHKYTDPDDLDNDLEFQANLAEFERINGRHAREFIERYIKATVFVYNLDQRFKNDHAYYNEIFDQNKQVIQFMTEASLIVANMFSTVQAGTMSTVQASVFIAMLIKVAMILGFNCNTGLSPEETIPEAFDDFFDSLDFDATVDDDDNEALNGAVPV